MVWSPIIRDDIVLMVESGKELQKMLDIVGGYMQSNGSLGSMLVNVK